MNYKTIDELVALIRPTSVSVNNPVTRGVPTKGDALVESFKVEYDKVDGILMYVNILKKGV